MDTEQQAQIKKPVNKIDQVVNLLVGKSNDGVDHESDKSAKPGEKVSATKETEGAKQGKLEQGTTDKTDEAGQGKPNDKPFNENTEHDEHEKENKEQSNSELVSMESIASDLGVDAKDLYQIEIPMKGEEPISLGELKDTYIQYREKNERLQNVDLEESRIRSEQTRAHTDLTNLMQHIPQQFLTKEYLAEVTKQSSANARLETERTLSVIPEWANPTTFAEDNNKMVGVLESYGLSKSDLDNVLDHRWIVMINDLTKLKGERKKAEDNFRKVKSKALGQRNLKPKASKSQLGDKLRARAKAGDKQAQSELVGKIFSK